MARCLRVATVAACPFPAARGTPIRIYRLADELGRRGHEIDVFTYHLGANSDDAAFRIHRIANIPTYRKQSPGPSYQKLALLDPLLAVKLARALRDGRYDVIHAHHAEGLLVGATARLFGRIPLVFDVHTLLQAELPYYRMGLSREILRRIGKALDSRLPTYSDHVIAVSEEIRTTLIDNFGNPPHKISLIPNGVEDAFCDARPRTTAGCTHLGRTVVYAGTLASYQRVDLLLRAFAITQAKQPDLWLHIYTDSSFDDCEPLARTLGVRERICVSSVTLEDLPGNLAAADVAVNPRTECTGMPQKLLNYMAAGCPIVTSSGSAKHVVDGETGLVVRNGDIDAFAAAILHLIADRDFAHRLGARARSFARTELSWSRAAERIEAVYDRVTIASPGP